MPRGNQLTRQWRLLQLLDQPAGVAVEDAAQDLGCVVRTIWRDLNALQAAGFPIYDEPQGDGRRSVWRIQDGFRKRLPLKLTLSELAALLMSRELLAPDGVGPAFGSAFEKIAGVLSKDALGLIDAMRDTIGVRAGAAKLQAPAAEHLRVIHEALAQRRRLRMTYYSMSRDDTTDRRVDPLHLTYHDGGYYLVAHCHLRGALRIFAVERIRALDAQAARFERPAGFDAQQYLRGAWGIVRGEIVTVKVRFAKSVARYIKDRVWHPTQRLRDLDGGRVELTVRVGDTLEVRRWILGFGPEAEVVEPATLRDTLRREAEAVVRRLAPMRAVGKQARLPLGVGTPELFRKAERP